MEDMVLPSGIELLGALLFKVVHPWAWVLRPAHVIVRHVVLLENFPIHLALGKIELRSVLLHCWDFGVVSSWADCVLASASVGSLRKLFGWDARGLTLRDYLQVFVLLLLVLEQSLV